MKVWRDSWFLFAIVALALCLGLIVVPQFRLLSASLITAGGRFAVVHRATAGLEAVKELSDRFEVSGMPEALSVGTNGEALLTLQPDGPQTIRLTALSGGGIRARIDSDSSITILAGDRTLHVTQQVPTGLFNRKAPDPLSVTDLGNGSLRLSHGLNAYLTFEDRTLSATLANYVSFFTSRDTLAATINSLVVAIASTTLAGLIGVSLAYVVARFAVPGRKIIILLITMASISPPFLGAYAWRLLLGRNGLITRSLDVHFSIVGIHGVIWVIAWLVFPIIFLLSYDAFTGLDEGHVEAAASLGARPSHIRWTVEVPLAMPGILIGLYLATMAALADFGTPRIIALDLNVLPVLVYTSFLSEGGGNPGLAATGSMVLVGLSSAFLYAQQVYLARRTFAVVSARPPRAKPISPGGRIAAIGFAALVLFFAFVPHLTVLVTSFLRWRVGLPEPVFTTANYLAMFNSNLASAWVTLSLGIAGTLAALAIGVGIAYVLVRKRYRIIAPALNFIVMLPYVIPGTVLGIGLILIFNDGPIVLTGTWLILAIAYLIRNLPFTVKAAEAALNQVHPALEEAAMSLGARPLRSFLTVTAPLMLAGAVTGATLTFLHIVTELSSTIVLYRPPWKPLTAVIFENTLRDSDFGVSAAQTVLLMLIIYVPLYLVVRYGRSERRIDV